jgi:hypothetical protein
MPHANCSGGNSRAGWLYRVQNRLRHAIVDMDAPLAEVPEEGTPVLAAGPIIGSSSGLEAGSAAVLSDVLAGHPRLASGGTIEVHEMLPTPGISTAAPGAAIPGDSWTG